MSFEAHTFHKTKVTVTGMDKTRLRYCKYGIGLPKYKNVAQTVKSVALTFPIHYTNDIYIHKDFLCPDT